MFNPISKDQQKQDYKNARNAAITQYLTETKKSNANKDPTNMYKNSIGALIEKRKSYLESKTATHKQAFNNKILTISTNLKDQSIILSKLNHLRAQRKNLVQQGTDDTRKTNQQLIDSTRKEYYRLKKESTKERQGKYFGLFGKPALDTLQAKYDDKKLFKQSQDETRSSSTTMDTQIAAITNARAKLKDKKHLVDIGRKVSTGNNATTKLVKDKIDTIDKNIGKNLGTSTSAAGEKTITTETIDKERQDLISDREGYEYSQDKKKREAITTATDNLETKLKAQDTLLQKMKKYSTEDNYVRKNNKKNYNKLTKEIKSISKGTFFGLGKKGLQKQFNMYKTQKVTNNSQIEENKSTKLNSDLQTKIHSLDILRAAITMDKKGSYNIAIKQKQSSEPTSINTSHYGPEPKTPYRGIQETHTYDTRQKPKFGMKLEPVYDRLQRLPVSPYETVDWG